MEVIMIDCDVSEHSTDTFNAIGEAYKKALAESYGGQPVRIECSEQGKLLIERTCRNFTYPSSAEGDRGLYMEGIPIVVNSKLKTLIQMVFNKREHHRFRPIQIEVKS